jgi:hypothetical protein
MKGNQRMPAYLRTLSMARFAIVLPGFLLLAALGAEPAFATTSPVVKCLQRGLKAAGHNPRGIDGIIGPHTRAAAATWAAEEAVSLPDPDEVTAAQWCAALLRETGAMPVPAPGSERFCGWFDTVATGVWLDDAGKGVLIFRMAANADGAGCYAWLNTVSEWQINEIGSSFLRVERDEAIWSTGDARNGIELDHASKMARYTLDSVTTFGVLID